MKKRAIMISMLLVMALSVTGCSQKTATKDKDTKTEETAKTDDAEETESDNTEDTSEDNKWIYTLNEQGYAGIFLK